MHATKNYLKKFHSHPISFFGFYFSGGFFVILGFFLLNSMPSFAFGATVMGVFVLIIGEVTRTSENFYILENGIERTYKLLSSSRQFIAYEKLQGIHVSQTFFQRIFGIGNIKFDNAGSDEVELTFYSVADPYGLEQIIRDSMSKKS